MRKAQEVERNRRQLAGGSESGQESARVGGRILELVKVGGSGRERAVV